MPGIQADRSTDQIASSPNTSSAGNLSNVRIVLAHPIYGGNVGSVCRAMANMGISDLVIAGDSAADFTEARKMACWADNILDTRRHVPSVADAVSDCIMVLGTTARQGLYRQHCRTPREWAPKILETTLTGKVALVFGTEDNGLSNEELAHCPQVIQIPSSPAYSSLNLAQAVMVCTYELFVCSGVFVPLEEKSPIATARMKERMFEMWEQMLLDIGFMEPDKAQHMMLGIRRVFTRGPMSEDDVRILMGVARQTQWYKSSQTNEKPAPSPCL